MLHGAKNLHRDFYLQDTRKVAQALLGKILYFKSPQGPMAGIITETEAYLGVKDKACHTYGGRSTPRVRTMYLEGGHAYIYQIYGLHFCLNAVTRPAGDPQAVLIRAITPLIGENTMRQNRAHSAQTALANGPGKLCQAFGLNKAQNGWNLFDSDLRILESPRAQKFKVQKTPRIGVDYAEEWSRKNLRYLAVSL